MRAGSPPRLGPSQDLAVKEMINARRLATEAAPGNFLRHSKTLTARTATKGLTSLPLSGRESRSRVHGDKQASCGDGPSLCASCSSSGHKVIVTHACQPETQCLSSCRDWCRFATSQIYTSFTDSDEDQMSPQPWSRSSEIPPCFAVTADPNSQSCPVVLSSAGCSRQQLHRSEILMARTLQNRGKEQA